MQSDAVLMLVQNLGSEILRAVSKLRHLLSEGA